MSVNEDLESSAGQSDLPGQVSLQQEIIQDLLEMLGAATAEIEELKLKVDQLLGEHEPPVRIVPAPGKQQEGAPVQGVLIVDDSKVLQLRLKMTVTALGYEVLGFADNGIQGIHKAMALNPQLMILDHDMPILDGLGCLKALREQLPQMKAIVCSANLTARLAQEYAELGVTEILAKPVQLDQLLHAIRQAMAGI